MNLETFNHIISENTDLSLAATRDLGEVLEKYPYFQTARAIQLKGLYQSHSFFYNAALRKTAAYTADRSVLFDLITSDYFRQDYISNKIKKRKKEAEETRQVENLEQNIQILNQEEAKLILDPDFFETQEEDTAQVVESEGATASDTTKVSDMLEKKSDHLKKFNSDEMRSFSDWLQVTALEPIEREDTHEVQTEVKKKKIKREQQIIDKFIETSPRIVPAKDKRSYEVSTVDFELEDRLMTETLAEIYVEQQKYEKAIQAYRILILNNPEKSGLFADRIKQIENSLGNK